MQWISLYCGGKLSIESKEFLNPELTLHWHDFARRVHWSIWSDSTWFNHGNSLVHIISCILGTMPGSSPTSREVESWSVDPRGRRFLQMICPVLDQKLHQRSARWETCQSAAVDVKSPKLVDWLWFNIGILIHLHTSYQDHNHTICHTIICHTICHNHWCEAWTLNGALGFRLTSIQARLAALVLQLQASEKAPGHCKGAVSPKKDRKVKWVCLKIGYIPNYSHLIGIMIINHWV